MICPIHNQQLKGPNSRGNLWHFNGKGADGNPIFCNQPQNSQTNHTIEPEVREPIKDEKPNWDAIAEGKVRHGVAIAFIEKGEELDELTKSSINDWVTFIISGK